MNYTQIEKFLNTVKELNIDAKFGYVSEDLIDKDKLVGKYSDPVMQTFTDFINGKLVHDLQFDVYTRQTVGIRFLFLNNEPAFPIRNFLTCEELLKDLQEFAPELFL